MTYTSRAQPFLTQSLDPENRADLQLLQTATQNFTHWTEELKTMDGQLYELLIRDGYTPTGATKSAQKPRSDASKRKRPSAPKTATVAERQLRKYRRLVGTSLSEENLLRLLKSLQKDIQEGRIRKSDPLAGNISAMQAELIRLLAAAEANQSCVVASEALAGLDCGCQERSLAGNSRKTRLTAALVSKLTRSNTVLDIWQERDRQSVVLRTRKSGQLLAEWWDEDLQALFEDGWFDRRRLHSSVLEYLRHQYGLSPTPGLSGAPRTPPTAAERHLARYRNLQAKVKTAPEIGRLLTALQRDIESGIIGKRDPLAKRIQAMQATLLKAHTVALAEGCARFAPSTEPLNAPD